MPNRSEHPSLTPDRNVEAGVVDTFPASDPVATTATQGARAVPADAMMAPSPTPVDNAVTLTRSFPDAESAKHALEHLVRAAPLDRHATEITTDGGFELRLHVPQGDAERVEAMLAEC